MLKPFTGQSKTIYEGSSSSGTNKEKENNIFKRVFSTKKKNEEIELAETIDIEKDLENFKQANHKHFNPHNLYTKGKFWEKTQLVQKMAETPIKCGDNDTVIIPLLRKESCKMLQENHMNYTHLGLIVVGIKGMTRLDLGAHVIMTLFDDSIEDKQKKIISFMDVDMNNNRGLFYCAPEFFLRTKDIHNIKLGILSSGYGLINRENLVITFGFIGKATQNTNINYKCDIKDVIEAIASKGVRFIKPPKFSPELLAGKTWNLNKLFKEQRPKLTPQEGEIFQDLQGNINIRFTDYNHRHSISTECPTSATSINQTLKETTS